MIEREMETLHPDLRRYLAQISDLRGEQIITLCQVSRGYNEAICNSESFWRYLYRRDLSEIRVPLTSYREAYRRAGRLLAPDANPAIVLYIASADGFEKLVKSIVDEAPKNIATAIAVSAQFDQTDITDYLLRRYPQYRLQAQKIARNRRTQSRGITDLLNGDVRP